MIDTAVNPAWELPVVVAVSWLLTGALRRHALARRLIDVPNPRSSHTVPTPRGGGLAIVLTFLAGLSLLGLGGVSSVRTVGALAGAGAWVAWIGFIDDRHQVAVRWRLLAHFAAAGWALAWVGGLPSLPIFAVSVNPGWLGLGLAAVSLAWLVNLYNFMDGIDGIAGVEAVTVCVGGVLLYQLRSPAGSEWLVPAQLTAAVAGFLAWNLPPAKIFMGDVGSGFLGMTLGVMSIQAAWLAPELLWSWTILLGVFVVDATVTLLRRLLRGERLYEAHRCHAYQYASRQYGHRAVTVSVGAVNLLWLMPLATVVGLGKLDGLAGVFIAYGPLVWLAFRHKAGQGEEQE